MIINKDILKNVDKHGRGKIFDFEISEIWHLKKKFNAILFFLGKYYRCIWHAVLSFLV